MTLLQFSALTCVALSRPCPRDHTKAPRRLRHFWPLGTPALVRGSSGGVCGPLTWHCAGAEVDGQTGHLDSSRLTIQPELTCPDNAAVPGQSTAVIVDLGAKFEADRPPVRTVQPPSLLYLDTFWNF
ncbi:hypothetical protein B0T11DRAFT_139527 [Plectosphaerella cucumerina]|uniref:Secreted protein n=1 Tax=Plectosphaerella cucumerina TaxID=40658 RepID=A0A8K0WYQ4_9PEZI|nr:hypothetical protein B0T11DRAFT_139527 [Plectosphaerella cucumerina]